MIKIAGLVLGALAILAGVLVLALYFGGAPAVAWVIQHPGSTLIGRAITIRGPVELHWGAPTRLVINDIHVANASWGSEKEMFSAQRLELQLFARTLIKGPTRIPLLSLDGAKLLLEKSNKGDGNWDFSNGAPKQRSEFPHLEHFTLHNSTLVYRNGMSKAETDLGIADLKFDDPDIAGPVKIATTATFQKLPLRMDGNFGALTALRDTTKPYPVKASGTLGQAEYAIDGTMKEPLDFDGLDLRVSLKGKGLDEIANALDVPMPELPDFRATSVLQGGQGEWHVGSLSMKVGESDLSGGIDIDTNATVPHIVSNLTSSRIDLGDFKGLYGGKPSHSSEPSPLPDNSGRVIPDTKIAVQKLPGANIELNFDGARIVSVDGLPIERVTLGIRIENGTLAIDPLKFHVALGDVAFHAHFNPFTKDSPPRLQADIDIQHVDLHRLLGGPNMPPIVQQTGGTLGGYVKLDTNGVSSREFLARMNGDAGIFVSNGQLSALLERLAPLDVLESLGILATGDKPQPINCFISRFEVKDGLATADTLLLDTPATTIVGSGKLDFGAEKLDLNLKPYNHGFSPLSLRTPIDIGGTFGKPEFHVEAGNLIARVGAAVGLGILFPPAALLPLIDTGLGKDNACAAAFPAQQQVEKEKAAAQRSGSSGPPPRNTRKPAAHK